MSQFDRACRDFAITYLSSAGLMTLIAWQLAMAGTIITVFAGMVPMVLASFVAGLRHTERTGRQRTSLYWAFALYGTAIAAIFWISLTMVMLITLDPASRPAAEAVIFQPAFIGTALVVGVTVHALTLRYVFQAAGFCSFLLVSRRAVSV